MNVYLNSLCVSVPKNVMTNADFEKIMDTNDEWIRSRTGIEQRHIMEEGENGSFFAIEASKNALELAGIEASEITHIFAATCTPQMLIPSMACIVASELDIQKNVMSFDFNAACSGFVYGLELIRSTLALKPEAKILFVTSESLSRRMNYQDRTTSVLFGDAASASVFTSQKLSTSSGVQLKVIDTKCYTDGKLKDLITIGGGTSFSGQLGSTVDEDFFLQMQGRDVYKHAVRSMTNSCKDVLEANKLELSDISYAVPHQANTRIIDAVYDKLEVPEEARFVNVHKYGNTSASSIPLALSELFVEKPIKKEEKILLTTFGGGLTWGSALLETV